jgi:hypothetical protein
MTQAAALRRGRDGLTAYRLVGAVVAFLALRIGLWPLDDNSAFTHLATGIRMVRDGIVPAIPRVDPYTFTAHGHPWVVQSWLPEAVVGWVYRLGGEHAITLLCGAVFAGLAWLVVALARTGRPLRTALAAGAALCISVPLWSPRPLLVGLGCLALLVLVVERRWSPWWLIPLLWVWVNSHGSFPLGVAWLVLTFIGGWLDRAPLDRRYLIATAAGLAVSVVNPLGPKLLTFPVVALEKREVFARIAEWGTPHFDSVVGAVMLAGVLAATAIVLFRRPGWRYVVPVIVFVGLGLTAERNLAALGIVAAPALGAALRGGGEGGSPALHADVVRLGVVALGALGLILAVVAMRDPLVDASTYPVGAIRWMETHHRFASPHRVVAPDRVGNYLELRRGARAEVFIDDRYDMFPLSVSRDYLAMRDNSERGARALDRWNADTVLWEAGKPFVDRLTSNGGWQSAYRRDGWVVLVRRTD